MIRNLIICAFLLSRVATGMESTEDTPRDIPTDIVYHGVDRSSYSNKSIRIINRTRAREYIDFIAADHGLKLNIVPDTLSREGLRIKITTDNDYVYAVSLHAFFNLYVRDSYYNWLLVSPAVCGSYATKDGGRWIDGIFAPIPEACLDWDEFGRGGIVLYDGSLGPAAFQGAESFFQGGYRIRHIFFECFGYLPDGQYKISIPVNMDFLRGYQILTTASVEFSLP